MNERNYQPASHEELEREARQWDSGAVNPRDWEDAPEAIPRVGGSTQISLRLPSPMLEILKAFAKREGVGYQVLLKRWIDDRIRQERDGLESTSVDNGTDSPMKSPPHLDEVEKRVAEDTKNREAKTLIRIEALLNAFLPVFQETGRFTPTETNRREHVWWLLIGQSFNSLRWAFHLLHLGYYAQALILERSVEENWLVCQDCLEHPETVEALFDDSKRMPSFGDMANRLPENLRNTWQAPRGQPEQAYGFLSTISHPRPRSLRLAYDFDNNRPRVGPSYDGPWFVITSQYILVGAISIAAFLVRLVSDESKGPLMAEMQRANKYLGHLRRRAGTLTA